jgi:hypothetical protein
LNWSLNAGTYWVGFMGTMMGAPNYFAATMPGPAPASLDREGYTVDPGSAFVRDDAMDVGVRISGNFVIPPPATWIPTGPLTTGRNYHTAALMVGAHAGAPLQNGIFSYFYARNLVSHPGYDR